MLRLAAILALFVSAAPAAERIVPAEPGALMRAVAEAEAGDVLRLAPGRHRGPVLLDRPLTLDGGGRAAVDGLGTGSVITVTAPDLLKGADGARVEDNRILGNLVGVDIHGAKDALVARNVIEGRRDHRMNERGNGVYVWNSPGAVVEGNDIRWGRDGIFANTSERDVFRDNRFRDLRFAVHYMYVNDSEISGNISLGNHLGYAVMYSKGVTIAGNASIGDREHGIMLNYTNESVVTGNLVRDVTEKCVFIYNAHKNRLAGNRFERCGTGVHFTAGSERNTIAGNAFIANRTQVKYVGSRWVDWSDGGAGNYWSDHAAFDLNGDGLADAPYRPNDAMDHVLWSQPAAKLLLGSPAVQLVRWAQAAFPALLPGGVVDNHPLMRPVAPAPEWRGQP
jgi:nitrous oxidase accessory protein